jgi:hypothetical protein
VIPEAYTPRHARDVDPGVWELRSQAKCGCNSPIARCPVHFPNVYAEIDAKHRAAVAS